MKSILNIVPFAATALAGTVLWDGRFNDMTSSAELEDWSFSNEVGPYQYYIHGNGTVNDYVNLSSDYKNPDDSSSSQGVKITIDDTSYWNSDGMRRTELIPQTTAAINSGTVYYHFSISRLSTNPPGEQEEHQVAFFESHFTEMKYGLLSGESGTSDASLRWEVSSTSEWNTTFEAGVWHNIAYEIDFDADTVGFWHSTGADDLTQVVAPMTASTSSNGADWHLGVLRLAPSGSGVATDADNGAEDWLFSGVYIESGDLTTSVSGPAGNSTTSDTSSSSSATTAAATSTSAAASTAASSSSVVATTSSSVASSTVAASSSTAESSSAVASSTVASSTSSVASSTAAAVTSSSVASSSAVAASTAASSSSSSSSAAPTTLVTSTLAATTAASSTVEASSTSAVISSTTVATSATTSASSTASTSAAAASGSDSDKATIMVELFEALIELIAKLTTSSS